MGHHHDVLQELKEPTRSLRHAISNTWSGFVSLHEAAFNEFRDELTSANTAS
jgi:hypothetical protein